MEFLFAKLNQRAMVWPFAWVRVNLNVGGGGISIAIVEGPSDPVKESAAF